MEVEKDNKDFTVHPDGSITVDEIAIPPPPVPALTVEANNERLIITELIARDFKSYAGTCVIGPFNKNFSCIVGPNGSGKSNVIDALLFVFGYRAQKIRSKKVSVLIHNSHKFPNLSSCSVTVNFATIRDQGNDYTILPDSKFCVTRTGYRDNSSTYEVNGRRSQYKDVASLLRKYGIDLDYNRFMILQGEIELISMMKPKAPSEQEAGMLEYIEDIIGSNRFIQPIQHFSTKVEETNEIRIEKLNQLKIIEKERADAEKPRNEAVEYLRLANEVALMQNSILQTNMRSCTEEGEKLTADRDLVQEKIKELSDSMNELQETKQIKEDEMKFIAREHEKVAKVVEEYNQQFSKLEREDVACRENMKSNKEKIKKLNKSLETEESKMINLRKQPEVLQGEIEELESKKEKLMNVKEKEEEKLKEVMGSVKDEIQEYQEEKDNLEKKLVDLKSVVHEKQSELDLAQSELDLLLNPEKKEKEALQKLETEFERIVATIEEKKKSLLQAVERFKELESQISSSKKKMEDLEKKEQNLTEKVKGMQIKLDESKSSLNSSKSRNKLVKAFMEQKKMGNLSGVYGRLGDLGAIDAKYDVAISTACGPLDNMVTDTMKTAQDAVKFLKDNDLGYTTFIALDQMKKWEPHTKQKISTPENVPRLFDLISVKDKALLPAFYFALRDTLVAKDIEQATRVGLKGDTRYRVVTLKGQLVEPSGAMSGGGTQCFRGRMGQSIASNNTVSEKELATLEQDIANLSNELEGIKRQRVDMKEATEQAVKELATLQLSSKKSQQNRDSFVEQEKMLKDQIDEQKKKIAAIVPNKKKIAEMQVTIQEYEKNHAKAAKAASVYETKVKDLQEKIMAVTKGKYGAAQTKIDKLAKEIAQITQNITKNSSMLKNTDKNLKKAEANVNSLKEELEDCVNSVDTLKEQSKELANTGLEITEKLKEEKEKLVLIELQKAASTGEVKGISTKIHEIKSEIIERKNQIKMVEIEIRANQGQLKTLKSQISKLELHDIGEGETELPVLSPEELDDVATSSLQYEVGRIQSKMKDMKVDLSSIAEFKKKVA
ncbi:hypothetical protein JTE90_026634 [Oedothorax gibbosus]|uniref:SMC hinge domain-containing protein n=1 Tax=Oedothorax gibbosus TaxID=931172 RepID=A0AAV6U7I4_9ARAC|nr:hypothetical protein JTE90_026634 [Oedothorax gibbosus]